MSPAVKFLIASASIFALAGCDGDGAHDDNSSDAMLREAMCVVAAERFTLYKEAERHKTHGVEAGRRNFEKTGQPSDFLSLINKVRIDLASKSKDFNATLLSTMCDTKVTVGAVESH